MKSLMDFRRPRTTVCRGKLLNLWIAEQAEQRELRAAVLAPWDVERRRFSPST